MKALIIYCSEYKKNTEKIARIFAEKTNCELINIRDACDINLESYNLIGFGSGVYKESLLLKPKMVIRKEIYLILLEFLKETGGLITTRFFRSSENKSRMT